MIVQCEACQTRFRLADEKVKPGGIKVRCSKCKEVFTVLPPQPEPADETVDFGSFNMEKVTTDEPTESEQQSEDFLDDQPFPQDQASSEKDSLEESAGATEDGELDFSSFASEMEDSGANNELADEFTFADTSQPAQESTEQDDTIDFSEATPDPATSSEEQTDFDGAFAEFDGPEAAFEIDFNEQAETESSSAVNSGVDFPADQAIEPTDFSFGDEPPLAVEEPGELSFSDQAEDDAFSFDDDRESAVAGDQQATGEVDEFSFDEEDPFESESDIAWDDDQAAEGTSFDFDEPKFDVEDSPTPTASPGAEDTELQFGEIDFASDGDDSSAPGFQTDNDFAQATMEEKEESEAYPARQPSPPSPEREFGDNNLLRAPQKQKKSSLSRIMLLLVLLLVLLGGAAGYLYTQEGSLNLNAVVRYLPFLQGYIDETPVVSPTNLIGINITGSSYVNGKAGQMLVIQGAAVNNYPATRSAITVKGVLLNGQGQTLLQQTVFCGNKLDTEALQTLPFAAIEEAMNNQFGEGLSNMNIAAGASLPFTIVFRNLPAGIANINVEVVDSKPGAG